ncbi:universal stress protein [Cohaesibacter celericrescens]|jgi:nucleotide-binding universal stress UspA family protein|uniref:Universal stress protein n=1 Tax=Cohaesibacter celericrescens TaxID=2067669 RepID=A0A2N5XLD8_9HYPH|nr:universal stress protein [Cohaesibacter celericrescens]PLW75351.1 universal stress protein [Cohaesibacter celericrescens]
MKNSTILVAIGKDASTSNLVAKLEAIRDMSAHAVILVIGQLPVLPYYAVGVPPYGTPDLPIEWQKEVSAHKTALNEKAEEIKTLLQEHDVSGEVSIVASEPTFVADIIARRAMICDFALIGDDLRKDEAMFRQITYGILFQSPIGLLLNDHELKALKNPKRVFVAWTTHLHSARAVHQALPLLRQADEVVIGTVDPVMTKSCEGEDPGVDVAKWLTHHGCKVVVQQFPSGGRGIGECIQERAKESGADLIVMGSYGHSRTRQAIFGGTTRTLIEQTDQAVFLVH